MWDKALAAGFVIFWSSGFVGATLAAEAGSVTGVLAWRYLITALVLLVLIAPRRPRIGGRDLGQQVCLGLLAHVVFLGGVFGAAGLGLDAGTSTLICAVQPMLVTAVGCWWWGDATSRIRMLGLGLGLLAVGVTVGVPGAGAGTAMLLPVASLLGLSLAALLERAWRPDVDVLLSLTVQVTVAAVVFTAYAAAVDELGAVPVTSSVVLAIAWLVVLSGILGYATFTACVRHLGASSTSALLYLTPPVTTLWVWLMFGDRPSEAQLIGLGLGAVAVTLVLRPVRSYPARTRVRSRPDPRRRASANQS